MTFAVIAHEVELSVGPVHTILNQCLGMHRMCANCLQCAQSHTNNSSWMRKKSVLLQPAHSSDLDPWDFRLLSELKMGPRGHRPTAVEEIKENAKVNLLRMKKKTLTLFQRLQRAMEQVCLCRRKAP